MDRAFDEGSIIRTHVMRPTWHFVAPEDIRWLLQLTGPRVHAVNSHYGKKLELDEGTLRRGHEILERALIGSRHLTRNRDPARSPPKAESRLSGQRLAYLVMHAELSGLICSGPRRGKQFTYALLEERRVAPAPPKSRDEALAELTVRYFRSHGPALVQDFSWWSGLTVKDARGGIDLVSGELESQVIGEKTYWAGKPTTGVQARSNDPGRAPQMNRLCRHNQGSPLWSPASTFFPTMTSTWLHIAYHNPTLDAEAVSKLPSNSLFLHLLSLEGLVIGGWRRTVQKEWVDIRVESGIALGREQSLLLDEAVARYERFIGLPVRFTVSTEKTVSWKRRSASHGE